MADSSLEAPVKLLVERENVSLDYHQINEKHYMPDIVDVKKKYYANFTKICHFEFSQLFDATASLKWYE